MKRCRVCKSEFEPRASFQVACRYECAVALVEKQKTAAQKRGKAQQAKADRAKRESLKTLPQLLKEAQAAVNSYVRARDADLPCISCGKPPPDLSGLHAGRDAGHYRSVGAASHLRFNLDNIHGQCVSCNQFKAGNAADYRLGLIERIGLPRVEALEADYSVKKWEKDELKAIRDEYRAKARELKREAANA